MSYQGKKLVLKWAVAEADAHAAQVLEGRRAAPQLPQGYPLQHCLGNPMDRGACQATVHGVTKSWT